MAASVMLQQGQRLKGQRDLLSMAAFMEDTEDLLSDQKNANYTELAKSHGINKNDPRFAEFQQIFQSVKDGDVKSACLTIHRSISDSKEEEITDNAAPAIADPEWLYVQEDVQEDDDDELGLNPSTKTTNEFKDQFQNLNQLQNEMNTKSAGDLSNEAANENCCKSIESNDGNIDGNDFDLIQRDCPCFNRIHIMMETYHKLLQNNQLVKMCEVLQSVGYGHRQLMDDFMHIQLNHMDQINHSLQNDEKEQKEQKEKEEEQEERTVGQEMALYFMRKCPCGINPNDMAQCQGNQRHFRERQGASPEARKRERGELREMFGTINSEDIVFQEDCDKIHSYFLQFGHDVYFECNVSMYTVQSMY